MRFEELAQLRPLFLVAMILTWSGLMLMVNSEDHEIQKPVLIVFCFGSLILAVLSGTTAGRKLVLKPQVFVEDVSAILFIITFFSLSFSIYGFITAWELGRYH